MATIDENGYVTVTKSSGKPSNAKGSKRNWWLVHYNDPRKTTFTLNVPILRIPEKYQGKRIRLKIEVIEDD